MVVNATFSSNATLHKVSFEKSTHTFNVAVDETVYVDRVVDCEVYEGEYEVTPKVNSQQLHTANKLLEEDLKIREIPKYSVSNPAGGNTIYIASEV